MRPPLSMILPCGSFSTSRFLAWRVKYFEIQASLSTRKASACRGSNSTISMGPSGVVSGQVCRQSRGDGECDFLKPADDDLRGDVRPGARDRRGEPGARLP